VFFTRESVDSAAGAIEVTVIAPGPPPPVMAPRRSPPVIENLSFRSIGKLSGPRLSVLGVRAHANDRHGVLVSVSSFDGEPSVFSCSDATAETLLCRRVPAPISPVVVGQLEPKAPPTVIVQGANETVEAIRPTADGKAERLWRAPGRGMTCNNFWEGLSLADLSGDGRGAPVVGTRGVGDCARLAILSSSGETVWYRDFDEFPGTPPPWNVPGLMYWQGGYFSDPARMDLAVQMRLLGGMTTMVDGRTGETRWEKSRSVPGRQFGRYLMTMYDFDGDGLEDALQTFSDLFCVAEGRTGNFLKAERASKFVPGGGYYGSAIVTDFLGNGDEQLLFSSAEVVALLERNGKRIWHGDLGRGSEVRAGVGNADGDGAMDLFVIANRDGKREFQCWDATTGKTNWTLPLPAGNTKPTDPATADIDGDGRDECIFTMGNTVYAVGAQEDGQSGKIEWTLSMPGNLSPVAIADVKGDGVAQIVVSCADGTVYGIGDAKAPSAQGE
jgi:outer membrane protein assembly factor BamB